MCFFVKTDKMASPQNDFCKKLSTYLGPRLAQYLGKLQILVPRTSHLKGIPQFVLLFCFFVVVRFFLFFFCFVFFAF